MREKVHKKAIALLSGGIDSPVAIYLMLRKGWVVDALHCETDSTGVTKQQVVKSAHTLSTYGLQKLYVTPHHTILSACTETRYRCVFCKRAMLRCAETIANEKGYSAIVTGETLGSKASQTLCNLSTIGGIVSLPVYRPLLGFSKHESERIATSLGTKPLIHESCWAVPSSPKTACAPQEIEKIEQRIPLDTLVKEACARREMWDFSGHTTHGKGERKL